jgi:hypothetical protein
MGAVFAYRFRSGKSVLLQVVGEFGPSPVLGILDWVGTEIPSTERIKDLPLKYYPETTNPYLVAVMQRNKKEIPADRITELEVRRQPHQRRVTGGYGVISWKELDAILKRWFELK